MRVVCLCLCAWVLGGWTGSRGIIRVRKGVREGFRRRREASRCAGNAEGEIEFERMVCVRGISSGAGLLPPLTAMGDVEGVGRDDDASESAVLGESEGGEPLVPGGRDPLPLGTTVVPSGSVTLTCTGPVGCVPLVS